jgi:hypothetical protein
MDFLAPVINDRYALYHGDCVDVMRQLPDESIHLSIYSPPFATAGGAALYRYSSSPHDLSNSRSLDEFFEHYDFVVSEIYRLTKPGRCTAVHVAEISSGNTGMDFMYDFPGDVIESHIKCRNPSCRASERERRKGVCNHGWFKLTDRYHIFKEPLLIRNRLMLKNLAHKQLIIDSTKVGTAHADYVLMFRKLGENEEPVSHSRGLTYYAGEGGVPADLLGYRNWPGNQIENKYSQWIWRRYADAYWDDIRIDNVLRHREAQDENDEEHVHPLQLDVINRCLVLKTNPGDIVLDPFDGVGSTVYAALRVGRRGIGIELKDTYFQQAVKNLENVNEEIVHEPTLFDALEPEALGSL